MFAKTLNLVRWCLALMLVVCVRTYQVTIGMLLPKVCRFYPSCSDYFILAVKKHGPVKGSLKGIGRICRCHPWHPGGYDPP